MSKFLTALKVAREIITFGNNLYVFLEHCELCHSADVRTTKLGRRRWIVFCHDCHIRSSEYRWKRTAKRAWNKEMKEKAKRARLKPPCIITR